MLVPTGCPLEMIILQTLPYESEYIVFPKSSQNLMVFISLWIGMSHHILIIFSTIEKYCTVWEDGQTRQFQTQPVKDIGSARSPGGISRRHSCFRVPR